MSLCCKEPLIASISAKCSDMFTLKTSGIKYNGYVPYNIGLGGGDYIRFEVCLNCGQIKQFAENACDVSEFIEDNK